MTALDGRSLQPIECVLGEDAVVTDAFHFKQFAIDLMAEFSQIRKLVNRFGGVEVVRVVDRRFGPERVLFLEVLLHM